MIDTTNTLNPGTYYQNRGSLTTASIGVAECWPDGFNVLCRSRFLIQFPLSVLVSDTGFGSAFLTMYSPVIVPNSSVLQNNFTIRRITSPWNENTVLWATQPQVDSGTTAHFSIIPTTNDSVTINVTEILRSSLLHPDSSHGFAVDFDVWAKDGYLSVHTCESPYTFSRPKLTVTYNAVSSVTAVEEEITFSVYPLPAQHNILVSYNGNSSAVLTLYSIEGKILLTKTVNESDIPTRLDVASFPNGLYFIGVTTEANRLTAYKRVAVQH